MTRLVRAELLKLRTTRVVAGLFGLTIATSALIATAVMLIAARPGQPAIPSDALPELLAVAKGPLVVFALILGVLAMTGEFRHGTATPTFLVTPDRGRVVVAKVVANALAGAVLAVVSAAVVLAITLPWLRVRGVELAILDADAASRLLGLAATAALHAVLGVGLGAWSATRSWPPGWSGCASRASSPTCCSGQGSAGGCRRAPPRRSPAPAPRPCRRGPAGWCSPPTASRSP
jgi:ABC-2 type transport system permease protein